MFRRLFWLAIGLGLGLGLSYWLTRLIRETVARYSPERLSANLADAVRAAGADVRAAVAEGREAMRQREEELREQLATRETP